MYVVLAFLRLENSPLQAPAKGETSGSALKPRPISPSSTGLAFSGSESCTHNERLPFEIRTISSSQMLLPAL